MRFSLRLFFYSSILIITILAYGLVSSKKIDTAFASTPLDPTYCDGAYYNIPGEEICSRAPNACGNGYDELNTESLMPNPQSCMGDGESGRAEKGCAGYVPACCYEVARTGDFTKCIGYWERLWCTTSQCSDARSNGASDSQCGGNCQCGHANGEYCGDIDPIPLSQRLGEEQPTPTPTATGEPCQVPELPTNLQPSSLTTGGTYSVSWNAVSGATAYALRIDDKSNSWEEGIECTEIMANNPSDVCLDTLTNTSYEYNFQAGKTYHIWVHALNDCGGWEDATSVEFTVGDNTAPTATIVPTSAPDDIYGCGTQTPNYTKWKEDLFCLNCTYNMLLLWCSRYYPI